MFADVCKTKVVLKNEKKVTGATAYTMLCDMGGVLYLFYLTEITLARIFITPNVFRNITNQTYATNLNFFFYDEHSKFLKSTKVLLKTKLN